MDSKQSTFSLPEPPASPSPSPDSVQDWMMIVATWPLSFLDLLAHASPAGSSGKTSRVQCQQTRDGTLQPLSGGWLSSGMACAGDGWTLNTSAWTHTLVPSHSSGNVCSLSDILETGDHLQRYYLSQKACAGILRRAERRGKQLPPPLRAILEHVAQGK